MKKEFKTYCSYGNIYQYTAEIFYPTTLEELREALQFCRANNRSIIPGGSFNSFDRQNGSQDVVISMRHFDQVTCDPVAGTVVAGAGASWGKVFDVAYASHCLLYTCVTGSAPTVGGTLSINSGSVWTPVVGKEGTHCLSFKFMTVDGTLYHCSRTENSDLFCGVIGGMGFLGFIVEATYRVLSVGQPFAIDIQASDFDDVDRIEQRLHLRKLENFTNMDDLRTQGIFFYTYKGKLHSVLGTPSYKKVKQEVRPSKWLFLSKVIASGLMHFFPNFANTVFYKDRGKPAHKRLAFSNAQHPRQGLFWGDCDYYWSKNFSRLFQRFGYQPKLYQNSYFIPVGGEKVTQFIQRTHQLIQQFGLQTFMFDATYIPKDDVPFTLSCSRETAGFYVNTTFIERANRRQLMAFYQELNQLVLKMGGLLNLSKNCFIESSMLEQMYAPALVEFKRLKDQYDPTAVIASDFFEQYFPSYFGEEVSVLE
jgi:FAD/FMN-containing dehydrogenase